MSIIQGNTKVSAGGYTIDQSIRFTDNDTAYLTRTPGSTGDRKTYTFSTWVKRGNLGLNTNFFGAGPSNEHVLRFQTNDTLHYYEYTGGFTFDLKTTQVFRDVSAWYHIVVSVDTEQATAADRIKIYVNGSQITSFTTASYPSLNLDTNMNKISTPIRVGWSGYSTQYFDGYMAENILVDGQALAPTDFGEYNDDGVWIAKKYAGTYGTNGFYITGADSADLGADESGNGNDFTSSGLTSDDQVSDSPTENYSTANPLSQLGTSPGASTFSDGNLTIALATGSNHSGFRSIIAVDAADDTYMETTYNTHTGAGLEIGIVSPNVWASNGYVSSINSSYPGDAYGYRNDGQKMAGGSTSAYGDSFTAGDVIGMRLNAGSLYFYKNGTIQNSGTALVTGLTGFWNFAASHRNNTGGTENITLNFGQSTFGNLPTGSAGWSTTNLPTPTIKDGSAYFQTTLYTGTGSALEINQTGNSTFQPDMVWAKSRSSAQSHRLADAIRGSAVLFPDSTAVEDTTAGISFDADGFSWTNSDGSNANDSGVTYAAWQWLAGNGTSTNTDGSITSTVSANTTAGFSIATFTAPASGTFSVGHGLGVAPKFTTLKRRDSSTGGGWQTWHIGLGDNLTDYVFLNSTAAEASYSTMWGTDGRTSSVCGFTVGGSAIGSGNYVLYSFAEVEGFSKIGKYTGNGSTDGTFVYCGFKPAWVLIKATTTKDWPMQDTTRDPYNVADKHLFANEAVAEYSDSNRYADYLSNGFKLRTAHNAVNTSGQEYIFMAFAEHPFGGDGVAPVPAR